MLGRDPADHADPVDPLQPLGLVQRCELRAEDRLALDAEFLGDRRAGDHVVAGDHPHPDVRRLCILHRRLGLGARRVDHADEARHLEALDVAEEIAVGVERGRVEVAVRRCHHPETGLAHPLHVRLRSAAQVLVPGNARSGRQRARRVAHHRGRGSLDVAAHDLLTRGVCRLREGRHQFVRGVKRQRRQTRVLIAGGVDVDSRLVGEH